MSDSQRHQPGCPHGSHNPTLSYVGSWQTGAVCVCGAPLSGTSSSRSGQSTGPQYSYMHPMHGQYAHNYGAETYDPMAQYMNNSSDQRVLRMNGLHKNHKYSKSGRSKRSSAQ
ncbi:hypothetical protein F5Y10DRAFT_200254 [Nemania abortiva]|nr:hypothetical protein F5Y10DRAFT_200254 [Nemania abortiva]